MPGGMSVRSTRAGWKMISVEEILSEVVKDKEYYLNSGGGITVSGGEPLCQPDFLIELLQRSKEAEIGTVVETSGNGSQKDYSRILPYVDEFLWDVKIMEPELYRCYTGVASTRCLTISPTWPNQVRG